ncbi:MAG: hypothetical protein Q9198_000878 [Flavoplaca austrocitrina]
MQAVVASNSGNSPSKDLGIRVLYDGSAASGHPLVDIVAVHGIGANPDTTWVKSNVNWLQDKHMLPEVIPNARVLRLGYESQWFGSETIRQRLPLVAEQLLRGLAQLRMALIMAKLHDGDFPGVIQSAAGIVFRGTLHRGSPSQSKASIIATVASAFNCGEKSSLLRAVEKDSEMLQDLLHDFTRTVDTAAIPIFCFFEQNKSDISKILKPKGSHLPAYRELIVDETSGCTDGFPKLGLACDHFEINRFSDAADNNYRLVQQEVVMFARHAQARVEGRLTAFAIPRNPSSINEERDLACIHAIIATDPVDDMQKIQNKQDKLLEDTGAWILADEAFSRWLNEDDSRLLWSHGDPGKGKTMLAISFINAMVDRIQLEGGTSKTVLAYFFCDNKDGRRNTGTSILRGLIYQLLCQRPDLCLYLREPYDKQKEQLFNSPNSLQSLWRIFQNIKKIKWLFTSRNESMIQQSLAGSLDVNLEKHRQQVDGTVRKFVDVKVRHLQCRKGYDSALRHYVEKQLREKSEGTFLWVALACRELSKPAVLSVNTNTVLGKLPSGLTPLYERIVEQAIDSEDQELVECARSILRAMVVAFRPLALNELAVTAHLPKEHRHNLPALREYVGQCGSMVTIRDDTAYFVHLSAKRYILSMPANSILSTELSMDHQLLALNCFEYVCERLSDDHTKATYLSGPEKGETEVGYPMLFWIDHVRKSPMEIVNEIDLGSDFFLPNSVLRQTWFKIYWAKTHAKWEVFPTSVTAIHLVAYAGLPNFLASLLAIDREHEATKIDSLGNSPVLLGAKYGHELCVQLLLKTGADTTLKNLDSMTPLQWAAGNGHENIVQLLFNQGASLDTADKNGWTPLHRAAYNGHTNVVRYLLDSGADTEVLDSATWTALHRASSSGQVDVVRLLIERHASIHPLDREGMTPMLHAAWVGHSDVINLHLEQEADINAKDYCGWTAMHNAAWNGHTEAIKFLLQPSANIHAQNRYGATALHNATWSGHTEVVEILLNAGADVNAKDDEGETPLQQAAWRGHVSATEALLANDKIDVNTTNSVGHTALHQAGSSGQKDIVRLLLSAGADPTLLDKHGQSVQALAEANAHDSVADILKQRGRELSTFSRSTTSPVNERRLDIAVANALSIDPALSTVEPLQAAGFFIPERIKTVMDGKSREFYMKSGSNEEMFESDFISLRALHNTVPTLAPLPLAWGKFATFDIYFLVTEWIDVEIRDQSPGPVTGLTLAQKVAKLHTVSLPLPQDYPCPVFGFTIKTYCGSNSQSNTYTESSAKYYADHRLRAVARIIEETHGTNYELTTLSRPWSALLFRASWAVVTWAVKTVFGQY